MKMKINHTTIITAALIVCSATAAAQEYRTDISVRKQLLDGTVPGLNYTVPKAKETTPPQDPNEGKETAGMQLKKQSAPGLKFAKASAANTKKASVAKTNNNTVLPSATPVMAEDKKEIIEVPLPSQENSRIPSGETKVSTEVSGSVKPPAAVEKSNAVLPVKIPVKQ